MENVLDVTLSHVPPYLILLFMISVSVAITIGGIVFLLIKYKNDKPDTYKRDEQTGCMVKDDEIKQLRDDFKTLQKSVDEILIRLKITMEQND